MEEKRILVGSMICQPAHILEIFLDSLNGQQQEGLTVDYYFVDQNNARGSDRMAQVSQLIRNFRPKGGSIYLAKDKVSPQGKNDMIQYALTEGYDYLFLVDADLCLYPGLLKHLCTLDKPVAAELFWSEWEQEHPYEPNAWIYDAYDLVPQKFLNQLSEPGVYEVDELRGCTLIRRDTLEKGVNFKPVKGLATSGEDRWFCIRASVHDVPLCIDTTYPSYRLKGTEGMKRSLRYLTLAQQNGVKKKMKRVQAFSSRKAKEKGNRLTLSMIIKNEEKRYITRVLTCLADNIDEAVIIDAGSTDATTKICKELLGSIHVHISRAPQHIAEDWKKLRQMQWEETIKVRPDWILNLDADELPEDGFWDKVQAMLNNTGYDSYAFRIYDMWNEICYREDEYWTSNKSYHTILLRYQPEFHYLWEEELKLDERYPANVSDLPSANSEFRIQHLGWSTLEDKISTYEMYKTGGEGIQASAREKYESILDMNPRLLVW